MNHKRFSYLVLALALLVLLVTTVGASSITKTFTAGVGVFDVKMAEDVDGKSIHQEGSYVQIPINLPLEISGSGRNGYCTNAYQLLDLKATNVMGSSGLLYYIASRDVGDLRTNKIHVNSGAIVKTTAFTFTGKSFLTGVHNPDRSISYTSDVPYAILVNIFNPIPNPQIEEVKLNNLKLDVTPIEEGSDEETRFYPAPIGRTDLNANINIPSALKKGDYDFGFYLQYSDDEGVNWAPLTTYWANGTEKGRDLHTFRITTCSTLRVGRLFKVVGQLRTKVTPIVYSATQSSNQLVVKNDKPSKPTAVFTQKVLSPTQTKLSCHVNPDSIDRDAACGLQTLTYWARIYTDIDDTGSFVQVGADGNFSITINPDLNAGQYTCQAEARDGVEDSDNQEERLIVGDACNGIDDDGDTKIDEGTYSCLNGESFDINGKRYCFACSAVPNKVTSTMTCQWLGAGWSIASYTDGESRQNIVSIINKYYPLVANKQTYFAQNNGELSRGLYIGNTCGQILTTFPKLDINLYFDKGTVGDLNCALANNIFHDGSYDPAGKMNDGEANGAVCEGPIPQHSCAGIEPIQPAGIIKGLGIYTEGYAQTFWDYNLLATTSTPCLWKCDVNYHRGSGGDLNKCLPNSISCSGEMPFGTGVILGATTYLSGTPTTWDFNVLTIQGVTQCSWKCDTGYDRGAGLDENTCVFHQVGPVIQPDYNSLTVLSATITDEIFGVEVACSNNQLKTTFKLATMNGDYLDFGLYAADGKYIGVAATKVDCNKNSAGYMLKPINELTEKETYVVSATIDKPCKICSKQTFVYYGDTTKAAPTAIPDNNIFLALGVLLITALFVHKKRI